MMAYQSLWWCLLLLMLTAQSVFPQSTASKEQKHEVIRSAEAVLGELVILWREEKYRELYQYGTLRSQNRLSREDFEKRMQKTKKRLQCCWATIQEVEGVYQSPTEVSVSAKIGYQWRGLANLRSGQHFPVLGDSEFEHETFYLVYQNGRWLVNLFRILEKSGE